MLQVLNREWGVSIARNVYPDLTEVPLVMVHSGGLAYAFDSDNTGLDSPAAAMQMLTAHGLHELTDPHAPPPEAPDWHIKLDRPDTHDHPRLSELVGPRPLAPISPLSRRPIEAYWRGLAHVAGGWATVLFVAGVDFAQLFDYEYPEALVDAARDHRVAGGSVRVYP